MSTNVFKSSLCYGMPTVGTTGNATVLGKISTLAGASKEDMTRLAYCVCTYCTYSVHIAVHSSSAANCCTLLTTPYLCNVLHSIALGTCYMPLLTLLCCVVYVSVLSLFYCLLNTNSPLTEEIKSFVIITGAVAFILAILLFAVGLAVNVSFVNALTIAIGIFVAFALTGMPMTVSQHTTHHCYITHMFSKQHT
jgi:magnesium-transporting ATPase (P-type)